MSAPATDWLAVYRASRYAYRRADGGAWRHFALDGAGPAGVRESVTLITAWNPQSLEREPAWNRAANQRLAAALAAAGVRRTPAFGASLPGAAPAWREEGFALHGLNREEALAWGREWQQRALARLEPEGACLLFCADGAFHPCGLRELEAEA